MSASATSGTHSARQNWKEVLTSARQRQSTKEGEIFKDNPFKELLDSRPLALRPIYWKIGSDAYTRFKMEYERDVGEKTFGVRRYVKQHDE